MPRTPDVIVIGAGVIGSAIALELARLGRDVLVVDKASGAGFGSTSASSAIIRFHYSSFTGVAAAWEARQLWGDWANHLGHSQDLASFVRTGMLVLDSEPGVTTTHFDEAGVPWEVWDTEAVRRGVRGIDPGRFGPPAPVDSPAFFADAHGALAGTFTPEAGYVDDPRLAAENLAEAARRAGASYLMRTAVTGFGDDGPRQWRVRVEGSRPEVVDTDVVVNAAGPWSSALNRLAGVDADFAVRSRPLRQEVHQVPMAAGAPQVAVADPDLGTYLRPHGAAQLLIGGMEPQCDPLEWLADPDAADPNATRAAYEAQTYRAARRFPDLTVPHRPRGLAGVYDTTDDWTPIYDRTSVPGFYVAMGTSGNQFKNAPLVGQVMAHLVTEVERGHDHDHEPLTFTTSRTGNVLELATWSRLRRPTGDAPSSVMG